MHPRDMAARPVTRMTPAQRAERELEDLQLVIRARNGDPHSMDALIRRYTGHGTARTGRESASPRRKRAPGALAGLTR